MVNLREIPDEQLKHMIDTTNDYLRKLGKEKSRRDTITSAADSINKLAEAYMQAVGVKDGEPWEGPSSAAEAYPLGWSVTHEYGLWKSRVAGNIEEPGEGDAWERIGDDPAYPSSPSETVLPGPGVLLTPGESDEENEEEEEMVEDEPDDENEFEGESDA